MGEREREGKGIEKEGTVGERKERGGKGHRRFLPGMMPVIHIASAK